MTGPHVMSVREEDRDTNRATVPLPLHRLARAKCAYTVRRAQLELATQLVTSGHRPSAGDLVLARVTEISQHPALQLTNGRRATLFVGDEIVVCYGNRYAPDQFEAIVPPDLAPCDLVAGGGVAGLVRHRHDRMKRPTRMQPLGLLADAAGHILNLAQFRIRDDGAPTAIGPRIIAVAGTAMNAGKTTTAAHLIRGLSAAGLRVAAAKITGTGAAGDVMMFVDAGADPVVDFTDFGYPSTYLLSAAELEQLMRRMIAHVASFAPDVIVLEIADGLFQQETAALLSSAPFRRAVHGVVFAARDSLGAVAGVQWLEQRGLPVVAVSGMVTTAPLGIEETTRFARVPVMGLAELADPRRVSPLVNDLKQRASGTD